MPKQEANERTFQGVLLNLIKDIISNNAELGFNSTFQELNIGVGEQRFGDLTLISNKDSSNKTLFELKNVSWDATDETLVMDAMMKSFKKGQQYFVTGTPRQLAIYKTFEPNTELHDRKLKLYTISNVKRNDDVLSSSYDKEVKPKLIAFLKELSDIVHDVKEVKWVTIDHFFVNRLSSYILEASANMYEVMHEKIEGDKFFKNKLRKYLTEQDIFNISLLFGRDDIYNICQLSNYLLYLKIIFYTYLQRDVKELKLKRLRIPEEKDKLNKELETRFRDVLDHDFEMIFAPTVLDEFEFTNDYLPELRRNVESISVLEFKGLDCDIIGAIYNTLIDNQEQHDRGQHFTNVTEVDIVNGFCINRDTKLILDSGCGAGTFLVRAYKFLKYFHPDTSHENLLERLWGIEISPFPAFLAAMNLSLLNIKEFDNYPMIIREDFSEIRNNEILHDRLFTNTSKTVQATKKDNKHYDLTIPLYDACVGNPPYIRQELIEDKNKWSGLAKVEFALNKINQQSDLYVYYLMHTAAFLNEKGRLGYVISASWLDVSFGTGLQKFLLDHFKVVAVLDNQVKRSFATASINTVIVILERCKDKFERQNNNVRFIRIFKEYEHFIGTDSNEGRIENVIRFASKIESINSLTDTDDMFVTIRNQKVLEEESTFDGKYTNGNWGAKYLRSSPIYNRIIFAAGTKLKPLFNFIEVRYGIKTGANEFFYVVDKSKAVDQLSDMEYKLQFGQSREKHSLNWKKFGWFYSEMNDRHYLLERFYFQPIFKTAREANLLDVDLDKLKYSVLLCDDNKEHLKKYNSRLVKYIEDGEKNDYQNRPTVMQNISIDGKADWFNLSSGTEITKGDFIYPAKIGEKYRLIDNRMAKVYCDKVNYNFIVKNEYRDYGDILFLILNSTIFRYFVDMFARQLTGSQTLSDIDVNVVQRALIIDPRLLVDKAVQLKKIYKSLKSREQETIFKEVHKTDRRELDLIILQVLGLGEKDLDELYSEATSFVQERKDKSESVTTSKSKHKIPYGETLKLLEDRYPEINKYSILVSNMDTKQIGIPNFKGKYPKDVSMETSGLFGNYNVEFKEGNRKKVIKVDSLAQLKLLHFLNEALEIRATDIEVPLSEVDCKQVFHIVQSDFNSNIGQIRSWLKSTRNNANPLSLYKDLLMS